MRVLVGPSGWVRAVLVAAAAGFQGCGGAGGGPPEPPATPAPAGITLTEVRPAAGDLAGGETVNLLGSGFAAGPGPVFVHFGSRVVGAAVVDDGVLQVAVPPGDAPAPVDVRVVCTQGLALREQGYRYLSPPPPAPVLTCVPPVGSWSAALGGTRIDVRVEHLPPLVAPAVTIGGLPAVDLVALDAGSVRVEVPQGLPAGQAAEVVLTDGARTVSTWGFFVQGDLPPGCLTLNELLPEPGTVDANRDGTLSAAGDEFVEIVNVTGAVLDLTGFTLGDATSLRHTFPNPTSVPPGGSIVVFGSGNPTYFAPRHASGHAQSAASGGLGLNNSAETVTLRDPAGVVLAQATYAAADVQPGRSRNASADRQALAVPAASGDYAFHDLVGGAVGTLSPGVRVTGAAFP